MSSAGDGLLGIADAACEDLLIGPLALVTGICRAVATVGHTTQAESALTFPHRRANFLIRRVHTALHGRGRCRRRREWRCY